MRQSTPEFGQVQRNVTARPVAAMRAPQQDVLFNPNADSFAKGLAMFTDTVIGVGQKQAQAARDAQAATADIGLSNYKQAMSAMLESNPNLYDDPEELEKKQAELFDAYFGDVTDEQIRSQVIQRTDAWMQANKHTYQFQKEDKQRYELGLKSMALSVDALEAQKKAGASSDQLKAYLKNVVNHFKTSPSFGFSQERTEEAIKTLQESLVSERAVLLAETFMDDPDISTETQLWLKAKHAKAMEETTLEKEQRKYQLYTTWEDKIQRGALKRADLDEAVQAGYITAKDAISWERRQKDQLKEASEKAQRMTAVTQAWLRGDGMTLAYADPSDVRKVSSEMHRRAALGELPGGLAGFYSRAMTTGVGTDIAKQGWENVKRALQAPREPGEPLPEFARQWLANDGAALYNNNIHGAILNPQDAGDLAFFMHATQVLQKTPEEAAMLMAPSPDAKYLDIPKSYLPRFEQKIRSGLGLEREDANTLVGSAVDLAMRIRKSGVDEDKAMDEAVKTYKDSYVKTKFGVIPRAQILQYGQERVVERVNFKGEQLAKEWGTSSKLVKASFLPDGNLYFHGPDGIARSVAVPMESLLSNELTNPDGTPTIAGERAQSIREKQIFNDEHRPKGTPLAGGIGGGF